MKNQFEDGMTMRTNEDLQKIVVSQAGDYQPEAVIAAEKEIKKREFIRDKLSKYSDEQILEILKSRQKYQPYEVQGADAEAKKRNLNFNYEKEKIDAGINEEIQKLKTDVVNERYPALRFISGVYRLLAWTILIATIIILLYMSSQGGQMGIPFTVGAILISGILFVTMLAAAEGIKVFIDIAHNTRITALNSKK